MVGSQTVGFEASLVRTIKDLYYSGLVAQLCRNACSNTGFERLRNRLSKPPKRLQIWSTLNANWILRLVKIKDLYKICYSFLSLFSFIPCSLARSLSLEKRRSDAICLTGDFALRQRVFQIFLLT